MIRRVGAFILRDTAVESIVGEKRRVVAFSALLFISVLVTALWAALNIRDSTIPMRLAVAQGVESGIHLLQLMAMIVLLSRPSLFLRTTLSMEIQVGFFIFVFYGTLAFCYFGCARSTVKGTHNIAILICPTLSVVFSRQPVVILLVSLMTLVSIFGSLFFEFLQPDLLQLHLVQFSQTLTKSQLSLFTVCFVPSISTFCAFLYVHFLRERDLLLLLRTALAICTLNFNDDVVVKLREKRMENCSGTEIVLKKTLENAVMYSKFLPDDLKEGRRSGDGERDGEAGGGRNRRRASNYLPHSAADVSSAGAPATSSRSGSEIEVGGDGVSETSSASAQSETSDDRHRHGFGHHRSRSAVVARLENRAAFAIGLSPRIATILVCDVRSFHRIFREDRSGKVLENFNGLCDALVRVGRRYGGSFASMEGDKVVLTWNAARNSVTHQKNAVLCAAHFVSRLFSFQPYSESENCRLNVLITIASGAISYGAVGSEVRRWIALGRPCSVAHIIKRCLVIPPSRDESVILVDEAVHEEIKYDFDTKLVSALVYQDVLCRVYRVGVHRSDSSKTGAEWFDHIAPALDQGSEVEASRKRWDTLWDMLESGESRERIMEGIRQLLREFPGIPSSEKRDSVALLRKLEEFEFDPIPEFF